MNGFVPALLAVLLGEIGPRALTYARAGRREIVLWAIVIIVLAATIAGQEFAYYTADWAKAVMIAIAVAFAGIGQLRAPPPAKAIMPVIRTFWFGSTGLIAFIFAARFGALIVFFGTLAGLASAALITPVAAANGFPIRGLRLAAAVILLLAASVIMIGALRLA